MKKILSNINKNLFYIIIFIILFVIFLKQNNTILNIYYIFKNQPYERLAKNYEKVFYSGFCEHQAHGYIISIRENFNHKEIPEIINFEKGKRVPDWIFKKLNLPKSDKTLILLNYDEKYEAKEINFSNYSILDNFKNRCFYLKLND